MTPADARCWALLAAARRQGVKASSSAYVLSWPFRTEPTAVQDCRASLQTGARAI